MALVKKDRKDNKIQIATVTVQKCSDKDDMVGKFLLNMLSSPSYLIRNTKKLSNKNLCRGCLKAVRKWVHAIITTMQAFC